ncbi:hypothetical protein [Bdellovibrio sp. NC01]|uniref:hypothetical protein n=1 Tax=Bdellovibrio sp. NC01 TaxID=2220073 RepID=UPI001159C5AD|nr:hypothetical protein [Bdellovibrio sp. NC01]QDK37563.1 hypothetical protein DOE51_08185 [Bdellovibrio sp. NC01]
MAIRFNTQLARKILIWGSSIVLVFFVATLVWGVSDYHGKTDALLIGMSLAFIVLAGWQLIKGLRLNKELVLNPEFFEVQDGRVQRSYAYTDIVALESDVVNVNFTIRLNDGFSFFIDYDLRLEQDSLSAEYRELFYKHGELTRYQSLRFLKDFFQTKTGLTL